MMHSNDMEPVKRPLSRVAAALLVLLALLLLLLLLSAAGNRDLLPFRRPPVFELEGGEDAAWSAAGNGMAAATTEHIQLFSVQGRTVAEEPVAFTAPACAACSLLGAYYDVGSPGLHVLYPDGKSRFADTEGAVLLVDVNETGLVAVLSDKEGYLGCVTVYETDLTPLFRYDALSAPPLVARLSADDRLCLVSALEEGSTVRLFRIDRETPAAELSLPGELAVDAGFLSNGTLALVTEQALLLLDRDGRLLDRYSFDGAHLSAWSLRGDFAAVACVRGLGGGTQLLTTVDGDGVVLGSLEVPLTIVDMESQNDELLVLYIGEESTLYYSSLEEDISYQPAEDVKRVFLGSERRAVFCGEKNAVIVSFK